MDQLSKCPLQQSIRFGQVNHPVFKPDARYNIEYLSQNMTLHELRNARYTGRDGDEFVFETEGRLVRLRPKRIVIVAGVDDR